MDQTLNRSAEAPMISVVMCCYNAEKYISDTIDSVLNQSFKDFEFIIWNDGSKDKTEDIIISYNDERIRYFYHENAGLGQSLRWACEQAKSEYIARIDADDVCLEYRLEKELNYLKTHPSSALVYSGVLLIDENSQIIGQTFPYSNPSVIRKIIKRGNNVVPHPSVMFRKSFYEKTQRYPLVEGFEDTILWYQLIDHGDFGVIKEPLIKYRLLPNSLSHGYNRSKYRAIIDPLRMKIITENGNNLFDNEIHKAIFNQARNESKETIPTTLYVKKADEKIYHCLCRFVGGERALKLVCFLKNLFAIIRFKINRT